MKSSDYFDLAIQCAREASETSDPERKRTLLSIAQLYNQTELKMERGGPPGLAPQRHNAEAA
jgi:hypothetical protein